MKTEKLMLGAVLALGAAFGLQAVSPPALETRSPLPGAPRGGKLVRGAPRATLRAQDNEPLRLPGSNTMLCGAMVYNDLWGATDDRGNFINPVTAGFYTIEAKPGGKVSKLNNVQDLIKMRAGVKVNSLYYVISTSDYDTSASLSTYYTSSWSRRSTSEIDLCNVPSDMTYDPVTGNVYGFFWNEEFQEYDRFCRFDTYYGEAYDIAMVDRNAFAIAANAKGEIYGIWGYTGWLIKVNPATGAYEQIGKTGFSPGYVNSMTFDDATGKLYWCANDGAGESWLLEVNTSTGEATEIMHFDDNASFAGIFAMPYKTPDAAPGQPADLRAEFADPLSTQCTLHCTAPDRTYNGAALEGPLTVAFTAGGVTYEVEGVQPGADVSSPQITLQPGENDIEALAATSDLLGAKATATVWAGLDTPAEPQSLTLEDRDGVPALSWQAPSAGAHGGNIGASGLTYTVTRYPDRHTVTGITGTQWADTGYDGHAAALWYTVRAVNAAGESPEATSAKLVFGQGFTVPFTETFSSPDDFALWSVFDLNGETTWAHEATKKNIYYTYSTGIETPGDDWIISPRIALEAGKTYRLSADVSSYYRGYPENFRFALGRECSPQAMTQTLLDCEGFENPTGETKRVSFSVAESGNYHLGLYCYSIAHNWQLTVDNISVEEVSGKLPAAVTGLTATPGARGAMEATLAFTIPSQASDGSALTAPLGVNIYRNHSSSPVATLSGKQPGEQVEWRDSAPGQGGLTHYRITATNESGEGADASVEIWVGPDTAGAVDGLRADEQADGSVLLTWSHPTAGAHGGWYGDATPLYRVVRSDGELLASDLDAETFTDSALPRDRQELYYYLVTPYVDGVKGQYANTPWQVFGPAVTAPMAETFPAADMTHYPWVSESDGPAHVWTLVTEGLDPAAADQNGDRGMAMFMSGAPTLGIEGQLASPKIDISALGAPELSFWMWHTPEEDGPEVDCSASEMLEVKAATDGLTFTAIDGGTFPKALLGGGWMRHTLPLDAYNGSRNLRLAFVSKSLGAGSFYIDNVAVGEQTGEDIALVSVEAPARVGTSLEFPVEASVVNNGRIPANVRLTLTDGDTEAGTLTCEVGAGMQQTATIMSRLHESGRHTLRLRAQAAGDTDESNNLLTFDVESVDAIIPVPKSLAVAPDKSGGITLQWLAPTSEGEVADDIESYPDWATEGFGGYRMWDMDGAPTCYINKDLGEYPSATAPKAFQVCNAKTLGIDIWPEGTPHSGNKMLMSVASVGRANDDWLVLPALNGGEQCISFWAKAFTAQDTPAERMRILWSDGPMTPAAFTKVHAEDFIEVPDTWTHYSWNIPAGARRAAIQCVSDDAFALFIDDLRFNDMTVLGSAVAGYEIWRNGEKIAESETPGYTDTDTREGVQQYHVRALYADGNVSAPSNIVSATFSGIDGMADATWSLTAADGAIEVTAAPDTVTRIYTADGKQAAALTGPGRVALLPGVYTAVTTGSRCKIIL